MNSQQNRFCIQRRNALSQRLHMFCDNIHGFFGFDNSGVDDSENEWMSQRSQSPKKIHAGGRFHCPTVIYTKHTNCFAMSSVISGIMKGIRNWLRQFDFPSHRHWHISSCASSANGLTHSLPLLEPGKPVNPYSKQYMVTPLHEASQSSLSTDVIPENTNPKWYDEQIFCVRDRRRPMRFQLWDSHRIFSDKLLGHIQFDMRPLSDYLLYDIWLPLIGPNEGETDPSKRSEIHIMAQFSPMRIHKIINVRLPPFRLQLQKSQYYPGEIVRGFLILNVGKPLSADQVFVRLYGFEETHWTESHTEHYTDSQGRSQTRTVTKHYGQTWPLLNDKRLCWHRSLNPTQEPLLMSGSYVWPFEFMLPPRLPPSFKSTNGWVEYSISAEVDRPGVFTFNKRTQAKLQILAPYTSLQPLPSVYGRLQKLPFRSANEVVYIEGHLDRPVCIIGDQHTLTLKIDNHSNHRVTDCEITLRGQAIYKAHGRVHMVNTEPFFTRIKEPSFPVQPGEAKNVVVVFQIPANTPPSLPADLSPLIDLRYHIHVSCNMSGFLTGRARSDIPIIISHPLPPPVWQIPPPKMYPTEQPELNVIMEYGFGLPHFAPTYFSAFPSQNIPIQEDPNNQIGQAMFVAPPPPQSAFFHNQPPPNYPVGGQYVPPPTVFAQFSDSAPVADLRFGMSMDDGNASTPAAIGISMGSPQPGAVSMQMNMGVPAGGAVVVQQQPYQQPPQPHYQPSQVVVSPDNFGSMGISMNVNAGGAAVVTSSNYGNDAAVGFSSPQMGGAAVVTSMDGGMGGMGGMGFDPNMQMQGSMTVTTSSSSSHSVNGVTVQSSSNSSSFSTGFN
eukprot:TRINITY_DN911_c2_g3_i1.p1 TRINITY_DN911_c2_g3~~TRINITY_DN911_c2_g3_i1.p1  ORF type:complete len:834 (-),score=165.31 TRINITY_DN911_c2_g3_i1:7-2508(-)